MVDPILNQQIQNPGGQEQSFAASASMIITGLEKELNQKINTIKTASVDPKIQLKALETYIENLSAPISVEEVQKRKEREEEEEQGQNPFSKKKKEAKGTKTKSPRANPNTVELKGRSSSQDLGLDPKLIREYVILQAKKTTGIPAEEQEGIAQRIKEIEEGLKHDPAAFKVLMNHQADIESAVKKELVSLIKDLLIKDLEDPAVIFEKILTTENITYLLKMISEEGEISPLSIGELVKIAKNVGVNLDKWIAYWNFEKIKITPSGNVTIALKLAEQNRLSDHLRSVYTQVLLCSKWLDKIKLLWESFKTEQALKKTGLKAEELARIILQAKHLAWIKIINTLKDLHLKRVLSGSEESFFSYSQQISSLTIKARRLATDITEKSYSLVENKLESLALEAARYKLQFLKSMQNLEYQKDRDKEIKWIENLIARLPKRQ
ncbi:MAG: hypothetical protein NT099_08170 [Candidatus Saganbacteria bacterium]|nr:hypothetical protein [Candidatus Saganbacteria bacterium]